MNNEKFNGGRDCQGDPEGDRSPQGVAGYCDENRYEHHIRSRFLPIGFHVISTGKCEVCDPDQGYCHQPPEKVNPRTDVSPGAEYFPASPLCLTLLTPSNELLMLGLVDLGELAPMQFGL
jgi:hypothetical protein